jgi:hypothetical protein
MGEDNGAERASRPQPVEQEKGKQAYTPCARPRPAAEQTFPRSLSLHLLCVEILIGFSTRFFLSLVLLLEDEIANADNKTILARAFDSRFDIIPFHLFRLEASFSVGFCLVEQKASGL